MLRRLTPDIVEVNEADASFILSNCDTDHDGVISKDEILPLIATWKSIVGDREKVAKHNAKIDALKRDALAMRSQMWHSFTGPPHGARSGSAPNLRLDPAQALVSSVLCLGSTPIFAQIPSLVYTSAARCTWPQTPAQRRLSTCHSPPARLDQVTRQPSARYAASPAGR